jgi:GT2 family glycosyltransferase
VDDGSDRSPDGIAAQFRSALQVLLVTQSHAGPAAARNAGASRAKGQYLAFTDDDCLVAPDWLRSLESHFIERPGQAIGGPTENAFPSNAYALSSQLVLDAMFALYNADHRQARFLATCNLAVPAPRFRAIGGFDASSFPRAAAEDRDFCERWLESGYGMVFDPTIKVLHTHPLTLSTYCRQHFHRGRGAFRLRQARARKERRGLAARRDSLHKPFDAALRLLSPNASYDAVLVGQLLALWRAANATGYLWESLSLATRGLLTAGSQRASSSLRPSTSEAATADSL